MGDDARALTVRTTASWAIAAVVLVALFAGGFWFGALAPDGPSVLPRFTGSPAWSIAAPLAAGAVFCIAVWNRLRGDRVLARWFVASAMSLGAYHFGGELAAGLERSGNTGTWAFAFGAVLTFAGWTFVLAILQAAAVTAGARALGEPWGRGLRLFVIGAVTALAVVNLVIRDAESTSLYPHMPLILPIELDTAPVAQAIIGLSGPLWMLSLIAVPVVVWIAVARARGIRRQILARIAIGTLLPALVVMLCGVLGVAAAGGDETFELVGLAIGFCVAAPVTALWLTATVREATVAGSSSLTTGARPAAALLWIFYGLGVVQVGGWVTGALGIATGRAIVVTTLICAATAVPWLLFVRWCVRRIDPRRNLAAMIVARGGDVAAGDPAVLAQTALREALSDPRARLLIAAPRDTWVDVDGSPATPEESTGDSHVTGAADAVFVIAETADGQCCRRSGAPHAIRRRARTADGGPTPHRACSAAGGAARSHRAARGRTTTSGCRGRRGASSHRARPP